MQSSAAARSNPDLIARTLLLGLLLAAAAFMSFRNAADCVSDADLGWHLQTGAWILHHHVFPRVDPFSSLRGGQPWQAYSWLFELMLVQSYRWLGLQGIVLFTAVLMMLITGAIYRLTSRLQAEFTLRLLLTLAALFSLSKMAMPRPWLFTVLFFALELDILMQARLKGNRRALLWLPLIFALWANVHIQFIDGLLVLGIAAGEPLLLRWWKSEAGGARSRDLWLTMAACIVASCVNPYGPGIYRVAWELGSQPGVLNSVSEMGALPFRTAGDFVLLFLALGAAGILFRFRRLAPFETLLLVMAAILSFRSQRDVWIMAIAAAAILAAGLPARRQEESGPELSHQWLALSVLAAALLTTLSGTALHISKARLQATLAEKMPAGAVEFLKERHYAGPVFNTYDWGGFLIWQLQQPVSIDGRAALYGDAVIQRSRATWSGGPAWNSNPELQSAGAVIAPQAIALVQLLRNDQRFSAVYEDKVAVVFVPRPPRGTFTGTTAAIPGGQPTRDQ